MVLLRNALQCNALRLAVQGVFFDAQDLHVCLRMFVFGIAARLVYLLGAPTIRKLMHGVH